MKKPKLTIKGKDWLKFKPYQTFSNYDNSYLAIASSVNTALKKHRAFFDEIFESNEEVYSDLAITLTSYLEDLVNEIGIWEAYITTNQELYGYPLPFMAPEALEDYEPGDLNFDDVKYLIWHFLNVHIDSFFAPDSILLIDAAVDVFNVLDKLWDKAPVTEFYDEYFTIEDDINFFDFKNKLTWFGMDAYPLHKERNKKHLDRLIELLGDTNPNSVPKEQISQYSFMIIDEQTLVHRTYYNAMLPVEWFLKVIRASDKFKEEAMSVADPIWGSYTWVEENETHHLFKYQGHDRIFEVSKKSFNTAIHPEPDNLVAMRIVPYQGECYMSGIVSIFKEEEEKARFQNPNPPPFHVFDDEDQEKFIVINKSMEEDFKTQFGSLFYFSETPEELLEKVTEYTQFQYQNKKADNPDIPDFNYEESLEDNKRIIPKDPRSAVTFIPNQGMMFEIGIGEWLDQIDKLNTLDRQASGKLLFHLCGELYPETLDMVLEKYQPKTPLLFPVDLSAIDFWPYLTFFSRYMQPDVYGPRRPFMVSGG